MNAFQLLPESERAAYPHLLTWVHQNAHTFHLIRRHGLVFSRAADVVSARLEPMLQRRRLTRCWSGTMAIDPAEVSEYLISDESLAILAEQDGIFAWLYPERPEDLAFFHADGHCVFNSVSHHEEAWVCDPALLAFLSPIANVRVVETEHSVRSLTFSDIE